MDDFTAQLQQAEWVDGRVTTGDQGAQVKNNQQVDTRSNLYAELQGNVLAALNRSSLFFAAALPKAISSPLFNRYQQSETYGFTSTARCAARRRAAGCAPIFPPPCF
ncbi:iron-uptake factor PiuC [Klebsiella grimontii]|uniref:Iron-uptake factor PiuC n=1 Tax=Klebsiella grimontii TaxID=2058152 RepID=A0A7H4P7C8_9ENTR|nr:iron-uptake factor PiuC [Klebsiella grimontii]